MGADHAEFCKAGAELTGIDLTQRAINITRERLTSYKLESTLICGDAENLPFQGNSFDLVYSWGVIHHTTDTRKAAQEILRVLKPGGEFRVMVYHKWSLVGLMLWLRYALLRLKPFCSLEKIYATYLESPGTKAYSRAEALQLFSGCSSVETSVVLTHGDLLESQAGQRHKGLALKIARALWPRWLFKLLCRNLGLFLLIKGRK
jgi:ubiquinone/menaquinone biosynthesis C-methylase UbiE